MKQAVSVIAVALLIASGAYPSNLSAQEPTRSPSRFVPRVSLAGAFDARNNGRGDDEMYLGLTTLEWTTRVTGLALRADAIYARRDWIYRRHDLPDCNTICALTPGTGRFAYMASKVTAAGAMAGATYDLRYRGALRPYVLASAGVVQTRDKFRAGTATTFTCEKACTLAAPATGPAIVREDRPISPAAHVGAGLVYSFPWVSVLAEARYLAVAYGNTRGLNGAVPVSLGLRF